MRAMHGGVYSPTWICTDLKPRNPVRVNLKLSPDTERPKLAQIIMLFRCKYEAIVGPYSEKSAAHTLVSDIASKNLACW